MLGKKKKIIQAMEYYTVTKSIYEEHENIWKGFWKEEKEYFLTVLIKKNYTETAI